MELEIGGTVSCAESLRPVRSGDQSGAEKQQLTDLNHANFLESPLRTSARSPAQQPKPFLVVEAERRCDSLANTWSKFQEIHMILVMEVAGKMPVLPLDSANDTRTGEFAQRVLPDPSRRSIR